MKYNYKYHHSCWSYVYQLSYRKQGPQIVRTQILDDAFQPFGDTLMA